MPIPLALVEEDLGVFAELRTSTGWARVLVLVDDRITVLKGLLSKPSQTAQLDAVRQLQGAIQALEWIKGLPEREIKQLVGQTTEPAGGEEA